MTISVAKLVARLANDQFDESEGGTEIDCAQRRAHNAAMSHVARVIVPALQAEQRVLDGLTEFRRQTEWLAQDDHDHRCDSEGGILKSTPSNGREKLSASTAPSSSVSRESGAETVSGDRLFLDLRVKHALTGGVE